MEEAGMGDQSTILIVDDEADVRQLLQHSLAEEGWNLVVAANGAEALAQASKLTPDLILLDLRMPGMNGFEVCRRLRADPVLGEVPILMLTVLSDPDSRLRGIESGADGFITKPFDLIELLAQVRTIVRLARYRRLLEERTRRERTEEALRASEERYRSLFENSDDAILLTAPDGRIFAANPAACRIFGRTEAEICQVGRSGLVDPTDPRLPVALEERERAGRFRGELTYRRSDGQPFPGEVTSVVFQGEDGQPRTSMIVRDITERKRAEEALRQSEERFRRLSEATFEGVLIHEGGVALSVNDQFCEMFGYEPDELLGKQIIPLTVAPEARDTMRQQIAVGGLGPYECIGLKKDGTRFPMEIRGRETVHEGRRIRVATIRDITLHKRAEEALRESEERFRRLYEQAPLGYQSLDAEGRLIDVNQAWLDLLGYSRHQVIGRWFGDFLAPQEVDSFKQRFPRFKAIGEVHVDLEMVQHAGSTIVVHIDGRIGHDEHRQFKQTHCILHDITERKRAEEALRCSLEETARGQRLLLALSGAAQAVQRARIPDEVYRTVLGQVAGLGYHAVILSLTADRAHLTIPYMTFDPALLRAGEQRTGLSALGYCFPLLPGGLFQRMIAGGETVFVTQATDYVAETLPEAVRPLAGRLAALLKLERFIYAPLPVGGETLGLLAVMGPDLTEADVPAMSAFASQAAIALENARLFEEVRAAHERLRALSHRLVEVQEAERRHIARELHDEVGQVLTGLKLVLEMSAQLPADRIRDGLGEAQALVNELMTQVRELSLELRPAMLDDLGLLPALLWQFERYAARTHVHVSFGQTGVERRFPTDVETAAYRIVQEALTNVARHAAVSEVMVRLWADQDSLHVQVEDQGSGFDVEASQAAAGGGGLSGMYERAALLGGQLTIESAPGAGTCLTAALPLGRAAGQGEGE
jgi:PAS domain S-box-containing protein